MRENENANTIWRLDSDNIAAYTEDKHVMRKIRRSYPDFAVMAEYYRGGKLIARQYRVPSSRKRSIRRLLGVNLDGTEYVKNKGNKAL